jgi:hypothetical protein
MTPSFIAKQNKCHLYFSIIHPMNVWVHNIFCLLNVWCEVCESQLSRVLLYGCICSGFVAFYVDDNDGDIPFAVKAEPFSFLEISLTKQQQFIFLPQFSSPYILHVCCYHLKWNMCLKRICEYCFPLSNYCIWKFSFELIWLFPRESRPALGPTQWPV